MAPWDSKDHYFQCSFKRKGHCFTKDFQLTKPKGTVIIQRVLQVFTQIPSFFRGCYPDSPHFYRLLPRFPSSFRGCYPGSPHFYRLLPRFPSFFIGVYLYSLHFLQVFTFIPFFSRGFYLYSTLFKGFL